jgi:hypothetical protein
MDTYIRLMKQSFANTFNKREYKRWWNVPITSRLVYALKSLIVLSPGLIMLNTMHSFGIAILAYIVYVVFVFLPISEYWVEKLKKQYAK